MNVKSFLSLILLIGISLSITYGQDYFFAGQAPFDPDIPSPEEFLGYEIGEYHTRHDRVVAYFEKLAALSDRASIEVYGHTYEKRPLVILTISSPDHMGRLDELQQKQLEIVDIDTKVSDFSNQPVFVNLGYNVHGNEPSSTEAALLTAYILTASQNTEILNYLDQAVVFIDPTINPDGRDRHTHWANTRRGDPLVADPYDMEHNEGWPSGRTNHYWFDLNRDWWLAVHPESRSKLDWYHQWYPNVVTDFHEMGTNNTYFFEPMKANASKDPIMPEQNYVQLNDLFAEEFRTDLDKIGSLYFTKEVFDGTYPGYGSSYPDLQGGLALLFEQASSRGHLQETYTGEITFAFTIRNQYTSSLATLRASVKHKEILQTYLQEFFASALSNAGKSKVKAYVFGDKDDQSRTKAFVEFLLRHRVKVYPLDQTINGNGHRFDPSFAYVVPTQQAQYRMIQSAFETYNEYADSVYYDASAWSVVNAYNMPFMATGSTLAQGEEMKMNPVSLKISSLKKSSYAYLIPWEDYHAPKALYYLQDHGVVVKSSFRPFSIKVEDDVKSFSYGTLMIPVQNQHISQDSLFTLLKRCGVEVYPVGTGFSSSGIDLGSNNMRTLKTPKVIMPVGDGLSSYEAGEVWHVLDQRVNMPVSKVPFRIFSRIDLEKYNTMILVSGGYSQFDSLQKKRISDWVKKGNTLITLRQASKWVIDQQLVNEKLIKAPKDTGEVQRLNYDQSREILGREQVGGAIFEVDLDISHPLGFGYSRRTIPVYRNSNVWLAPSKNQFATVAKYTDDPHIDGFITKKNLETFLKPSASLIVSPLGRGRVVMFADNPNFRGVWYGTNKMFFNAIFLGQHIFVP